MKRGLGPFLMLSWTMEERRSGGFGQLSNATFRYNIHGQLVELY